MRLIAYIIISSLRAQLQRDFHSHCEIYIVYGIPVAAVAALAMRRVRGNEAECARHRDENKLRSDRS